MGPHANVIIKKRLRCEKCGEVFSDSFERCPNCGSSRFEGYTVVNPISRLPMEHIVRVMGHLMWLLGVTVCIALLWQTDSSDENRNMLYMYMGFGTLFVSVFVSVTLFAIGEILKRIIRIQRRLRAMFEDSQAQGGC